MFFSERFKEWNAVHKTITVRFHAIRTNHSCKNDVRNFAHRSFCLLTAKRMFAIIRKEHLFRIVKASFEFSSCLIFVMNGIGYALGAFFDALLDRPKQSHLFIA